MEAVLYFNPVISPFFGHDLQKMKKIVLLPGWLDYGITELVSLLSRSIPQHTIKCYLLQHLNIDYLYAL